MKYKTQLNIAVLTIVKKGLQNEMELFK